MPTVVELRKICKSKGIRGYSGLNKAALIKKCLDNKLPIVKEYTIAELKKICKEKGIAGISDLKKSGLMKRCLSSKPKLNTPTPKRKIKRKTTTGFTKIASFDMDGTLIVTKSGKTFPTHNDDWKIKYDNISRKLQKLQQDGYVLCIFTNQMGITRKKTTRELITRKIKNIIKKLGVECEYFIAERDNDLRKPMIGMWDLMKSTLNIKPDMKNSFFVGDMAGRPKTKKNKKDRSNSDRNFAENIGINFYTPEEFFLNYSKESFNYIYSPKKIFNIHQEQVSNNTLKFMKPPQQEMIINVGYQGSGKSTISNKLRKYGYLVFSKDEHKTKINKLLIKSIKQGKSVVIDNTNPSIKSRKEYIDIGKQYNLNIRCIHVSTNIILSQHLNNVRVQNKYKKEKIPRIAYNIYKKYFQKPSIQEGFNKIDIYYPNIKIKNASYLFRYTLN